MVNINVKYVGETFESFATHRAYVFVSDLNEFLKVTDKNVTDASYDTFITIMTKKLMSNKYKAQNNNDCLINLFAIKIPTEKQMDKILHMMNNMYIENVVKNYTWVDNAKEKGYVFTKKQEKQLIIIGYIDTSDVNLNSTNKDIVKKHILTILKTFEPSNISMNFFFSEHNINHKVFTNKIIFDDDYFDAYHKIYCNDINTFFRVIFKIGYEYDHKGLSKLLEKPKSYATLEIIDEFISNKIYPTSDEADKFFDDQLNVTDNTLNIFIKIINGGVTINPNIINKIRVNVHNKSDAYSIILNKMKSHGYTQTYETMLFACQTQNIILFDFCADNNIIPTIECLYESCKQANNDFIKKLINMKIIPDNKCIDICLLSNNVKTSTVEILLSENLKLTKTQLEQIILRGITLPKNYKPTDDDVYDICHLYQLSNTKYVSSIMQKSKQYKLRKMVLNKAKKSSYESTEKFMKKSTSLLDSEKLEFDSYCYDDMLIKSHALVLFNEYPTDDDVIYNEILCNAIKDKKYTVTLKALSRCLNNTHKIRLLKHYGFL